MQYTDPASDMPDDLEPDGHISLGARQPQSTFDTVEQTHQVDVAFRNFRTRLLHFLQGNLHDNENLSLQPQDKVCFHVNILLSNFELTNVLDLRISLSESQL
jgi:hypothetical protein